MPGVPYSDHAARYPRSVRFATSLLIASLSRFLKGERSITLDTASKIADVLGLTLIPEKAKPKPKKRK